jgi:hypothetical protein
MRAQITLLTLFLLMNWKHISLFWPQALAHLTFFFHSFVLRDLCCGITSDANALDGIPLVFIKFLMPLIWLCLLNCLTSSLFPLHFPFFGKFSMSSQFQKLIPLQKNLTITLFPSLLSPRKGFWKRYVWADGWLRYP